LTIGGINVTVKDINLPFNWFKMVCELGFESWGPMTEAGFTTIKLKSLSFESAHTSFSESVFANGDHNYTNTEGI